jgi:pentatricopeptide repeat protein
MPPFAESSEGFDDDGSIASAIENLVAEPSPGVALEAAAAFAVPAEIAASRESALSPEAAAPEELAPVAETPPSAEAAAFSTDPFQSDLSDSLPAGNAASTVTMADLYVRQGLVDEARRIYEEILSRQPNNADIRAKLNAITPREDPKVTRLKEWLARVSKREVDLV